MIPAHTIIVLVHACRFADVQRWMRQWLDNQITTDDLDDHMRHQLPGDHPDDKALLASFRWFVECSHEFHDLAGSGSGSASTSPRWRSQVRSVRRSPALVDMSQTSTAAGGAPGTPGAGSTLRMCQSSSTDSLARGRDAQGSIGL
jgi:hypothetical protein